MSVVHLHRIRQMIIQSIELNNFRNYESLTMSFDPGTNILYGDNAQGKTNILEACYVSGTTKSHRGAHDREMIRFDEREAHIRTMVMKDERPVKIDIHMRRNKSKGIAINGMPLKRASELFGYLNIIFFSPEDLNIVKNSPAERRRFIDAELCQLDRIYMSDLSAYNRALEQRNKLLKEIAMKPSLQDTLDIWDQQIASYGAKIIHRRAAFIRELQDIVKRIHLKLSGGREEMDVVYEPNTAEKLLGDALFAARDRDLRMQTTSVGPHRDDLKFSIGGIDVRRFGSQGQQRTCALSLKLSEIEIVEQTIHEKPVLLLDDVLSELDSGRQNYLLESLADVQTILTCTGLDEFIHSRMTVNRVYEIRQGHACLK